VSRAPSPASPGPGYFRRVALTGVLGAIAAAVAPSCSAEPATAITLAIASDADVPTEIDAISIEIKRGTRITFAQAYKVDHTSGRTRLPGTLSLELHPDEEPDAPIKLTVRANLAAEQVLLRTATMSFVEGKSKLLRVQLRYSCIDFPKACGEGQTCLGGACASDFVDTARLPDFTGASAFPKVSEGGCFDPSDLACAAERIPIGDLGAFADAGCAFDTSSAPGFRPEALNVFAIWAAQGDKGHPVVLDQDAQEGWVTSPGSSGKFELAPGLCDLVRSQKILKLAYNFACATKTPAQPVCEPDVDPGPTLTLADSACSGCAYAPAECAAQLDAARAASASGALLTCAFSCPFDGRYDTIDECQAGRTCFFGCLDPYLGCTDAGTCASYKELDAWRACLDTLAPIDNRCSSTCVGENVGVCRK
jgi:hypothetical protein